MASFFDFAAAELRSELLAQDLEDDWLLGCRLSLGSHL